MHVIAQSDAEVGDLAPDTTGSGVAGPAGSGTTMDEYGRRLAGETRTSMEALQRSLGAVDAALVVPELPAGVELRYGYRVGEVGLLHDPAEGVQLTESPPLYGLPNTRPWCRGLVNLRGNLIPVYDLGVLLSGAPVAPPVGRRRNKLLVVGSDTNSAALIIEATPAQVHINTTEPEADTSLIPEVLRPHVRHAFRADGELWIDPEYDSLFKSLADLAEV